jgi:hypothetical protein
MDRRWAMEGVDGYSPQRRCGWHTELEGVTTLRRNLAVNPLQKQRRVITDTI